MRTEALETELQFHRLQRPFQAFASLLRNGSRVEVTEPHQIAWSERKVVVLSRSKGSSWFRKEDIDIETSQPPAWS